MGALKMFGVAADATEKGKSATEEPVMVDVHDSPHDSSNEDVAYEKHGASRESNPLPDLKRKLKSRHLQMIAIGS